MKQPAYRMDIVTRKSFPKESLFRFVLSNDRIVLDVDQCLPGRGCYLKKDLESLEKAISKKLFQRHLHASLSEEESDKARALL